MKNLSAILAVSIILMIALACKMPSFGSNSGTASNSGTQSNGSPGSSKSDAITSSGDALADLKRISNKFTQVNAFQAKMDGTGEHDMHMELEYIAPDRYHMKTTSAFESIIIGKDTYTKLNGSWKKFPVPLDKTIPNLRDMFTEEGLKTMTDAQYAGDENVNGKDALVYSYKGHVPQVGSTFTSKLWVGKDDGLPIKVEVEYTSGSLKKMTTLYSYSPDVKIEAPIGN